MGSGWEVVGKWLGSGWEVVGKLLGTFFSAVLTRSNRDVLISWVVGILTFEKASKNNSCVFTLPENEDYVTKL